MSLTGREPAGVQVCRCLYSFLFLFWPCACIHSSLAAFLVGLAAGCQQRNICHPVNRVIIFIHFYLACFVLPFSTLLSPLSLPLPPCPSGNHAGTTAQREQTQTAGYKGARESERNRASSAKPCRAMMVGTFWSATNRSKTHAGTPVSTRARHGSWAACLVLVEVDMIAMCATVSWRGEDFISRQWRPTVASKSRSPHCPLHWMLMCRPPKTNGCSL